MKDGTRRDGSFAHNNRSLVTRGDEHAYLISTAGGSGLHNNSQGLHTARLGFGLLSQIIEGA